jgi:hypothetical protein
MARRAKGFIYSGATEKAKQAGGRVGRVKILSSQDATAVGRPGGFGLVQSPRQFVKNSVRRLMRNDPAVGITQPGADKITSAPGVDLVSGTQSPEVRTSKPLPPSNVSSGQRVIPPKPTPPITKN